MKKISSSELEELKSSGKAVKRKMGATPVQKKAETSTESVQKSPEVNQPMDSPVSPDVSKAMAALVDQHAATSIIVSQNSEVLKSLFMEMAKLASSPAAKPVSYNFEIKRNRMGFMENILATPVLEKHKPH